MPGTARVFISYSSVDAALARRLALDLRHRGIGVWIDQWDLSVGERFADPIERAVDAADLVLVLVSEASIASGWVMREWQRKGVARGQVLPVRCMPCRMPDALASQSHVDIAGGAYWPGVSQLAAQAGVAPDAPNVAEREMPVPLPVPVTVCMAPDLAPYYENVMDPDSPPGRAVAAMRHRIEESFGLPPPGIRMACDESMPARATMIDVEGIPQSFFLVPEDADPVSAVATGLEPTLVTCLDRFLDPDSVHKLFEAQRVAPFAPSRATWGELVDILRQMARQGMSLRDLSSLTLALPKVRDGPLDTETIAENLRPSQAVRLTRAAAPKGTVRALDLEPAIERHALRCLRRGPAGLTIELDPVWAGTVSRTIRELADATDAGALLIGAPELRRFFERLHFARLATLARRDLAPGVPVKILETVSVKETE